MSKRDDTRRQAVLLIHGIGEQRPMDTLRSFVKTVWADDREQHRAGPQADSVWSKPYTLSEDFELRLLTTASNRNGVRTDFYEFYWAHLMNGTTPGHVYAWARSLLLRSPFSVPKHLQLAYWTLLLVVITGLLLAATGAIASASASNEGSKPWIQFAIGVLLVPLASWILTQVVGDAARYLHVAARNVQQRHEIRAAGVKVLKSLHEAKGKDGETKYDRIILVGHSLGTVIGYDLLTHAWPAYSAAAPQGSAARFEKLVQLETLAARYASGGGCELEPDQLDELQRAQREYFDEMKANKLPWRVTDFVTLGSPLAHAEILMARDRSALRQRIKDREFPACLPELEKATVDKKVVQLFSYPPDSCVRTPHHAAVFGPTRWTNLYFPCVALIWGDLIGGKLARVFGPGIRDVPVKTSGRFGFLSHTLYWEPSGKDNFHIAELRRAIDLLEQGRATSCNGEMLRRGPASPSELSSSEVLDPVSPPPL